MHESITIIHSVKLIRRRTPFGPDTLLPPPHLPQSEMSYVGAPHGLGGGDLRNFRLHLSQPKGKQSIQSKFHIKLSVASNFVISSIFRRYLVFFGPTLNLTRYSLSKTPTFSKKYIDVQRVCPVIHTSLSKFSSFETAVSYTIMARFALKLRILQNSVCSF